MSDANTNAVDAGAVDLDITAFMKEHEAKELLRFVAVGSVDDGKSTLIGRLLHDTDGVYEDQLAAVRKASTMEGAEIDFSLITDGLKAEREQGITIDVAYRYFSTPRRKFIIADTPGHVQYTRNMATGASTADVAVILIDARLGVLQQSRRHGWIASLLGIPHLAVAVNKMDLVDYDRGVFDTHRREFESFASSLGFESVTYFPISAVAGDNVVGPMGRTDWYEGPSVLEFLETVPIDRKYSDAFRFPVQYVLRPNLDYRAFAGSVVSGRVTRGDEVVVLPAGTRSRVAGIDMRGGELTHAEAPLSVAIRLEDEVDVSRGDMIVPADARPQTRRAFDADIVWLSERPLDPRKTYLIKHTTRYVRADIPAVRWRLDLESLEQSPSDGLALNDIGRVRVEAHQPLYTDPYAENRATGAFIVLDTSTNNTVGAGMIVAGRIAEASEAVGRKPRREVSPEERSERLMQRGSVIWLSGLSGAGKSALAFALERRLFDLGGLVHVLDPDDFATPDGSAGEAAPAPRERVQMARALADAGILTLCSFLNASAEGRAEARRLIGDRRFVEIHVATSTEVSRSRDTRALWEAVTEGRMEGVPGIDLPYEEPASPDVRVDMAELSLEQAVQRVLACLEERELLPRGQR